MKMRANVSFDHRFTFPLYMGDVLVCEIDGSVTVTAEDRGSTTGMWFDCRYVEDCRYPVTHPKAKSVCLDDLPADHPIRAAMDAYLADPATQYGIRDKLWEEAA